MRVLSIDVGIRNLALCVLEWEEEGDSVGAAAAAAWRVVLWEVVNLAEAAAPTLPAVRCSQCANTAKYVKHNTYFCARHAKKQPYQLCAKTAADLERQWKKQTLASLKTTAIDTYGLELAPSARKSDVIAQLTEHVNAHYFEPLASTSAMSMTAARDMSLLDIGRQLRAQLDAILPADMVFDTVLIENQIGPLAIRMKTLSGMIVQYFIMTTHVSARNVEFVSSANKLKGVKTATYGDRKRAAIAICERLLAEHPDMERAWGEHFRHHKKRDDLADALLQGIWKKMRE